LAVFATRGTSQKNRAQVKNKIQTKILKNQTRELGLNAVDEVATTKYLLFLEIF